MVLTIFEEYEDTSELGTCDNCGAFYHLGERSVTGTTKIRCGDCGNCSLCCPPEHSRDDFIERECGS